MHGLHGLLGMHGMHLEDRRRPVVARGAPVVKQVETCRDFALNQRFMRVHSELVIKNMKSCNLNADRYRIVDQEQSRKDFADRWPLSGGMWNLVLALNNVLVLYKCRYYSSKLNLFISMSIELMSCVYMYIYMIIEYNFVYIIYHISYNISYIIYHISYIIYDIFVRMMFNTPVVFLFSEHHGRDGVASSALRGLDRRLDEESLGSTCRSPAIRVSKVDSYRTS